MTGRVAEQERPPLAPEEISAEDISATVAILAPRGRDAAVAEQLLRRAGIRTVTAESLAELAELLSRCLGAALITEEALAAADDGGLARVLADQPSWSDVPFVVLANGGLRKRSPQAGTRIDALRNAVLLSRPLHAEELLRSIRSALKARARQYEARERMQQLQLREAQLHESEAKFHAIADSVDQMIWSTRPDGFHDYYNHRWYEFTGMEEGSTDGDAWTGMFHPDDQQRARARWRHSLATGEPYEIEYRLRHRSGEYRWVLGRATAVRDAAGRITRWYGTCTDIDRIKAAEAQRQLMLAEMNHRVKNSMAMVHAIVSQTMRQASSLQDARAAIQSRIGMMAQAHDRLVKASWTEATVPEVVDAALIPHRTSEDRFRLDGPPLPIGAKQALALTMALHELATNAAKYGALSNASGLVTVRWGRDEAAGGGFHLSWTESGGPRVARPERQGFGSRMIEQALAGYFNGTAELDYHPQGLRFRLDAAQAGVLQQE